MTNSEIVKYSKSTLKGKYSQVILPYLIVSIIVSIPQNQEFVSIMISKLRIPGIVLFLIWGFLINPALNVGLATFSLAIVRGKEINIKHLFKGFQFLSKSVARNKNLLYPLQYSLSAEGTFSMVKFWEWREAIAGETKLNL